MKRLIALAAAVLFATTAFAATPESEKAPKRIPKVQIALLIDNSGSMEGLLNQARTQMWKVVNEFAHANQHGQAVRLELALYEYGDGVKRLSPLTSNLDAISEQLFGLGIRGGDEYCGQVIQSATRELEWSGDPDDLKLIYIAGNEPFTQGPVNYMGAEKEAVKKGIVVNTIHCGDGEEEGWRQGAIAGNGNYLTINQNAAVAQVVAPQDAEIAKLGVQLNQTYIAYGAQGQVAQQRQAKMDESAKQAAPAAAAERAMAKASRNYTNDDWDLVDATKGGAGLKDMKQAELPPELKGKTEAEQKAFIEGKAKERAELQAKIAKLSEDRSRYLAEQQKKQAAKGEATLDTALSQSIHANAATKAISF